MGAGIRRFVEPIPLCIVVLLSISWLSRIDSLDLPGSGVWPAWVVSAVGVAFVGTAFVAYHRSDSGSGAVVPYVGSASAYSALLILFGAWPA